MQNLSKLRVLKTERDLQFPEKSIKPNENISIGFGIGTLVLLKNKWDNTMGKSDSQNAHGIRTSAIKFLCRLQGEETIPTEPPNKLRYMKPKNHVY